MAEAKRTREQQAEAAHVGHPAPLARFIDRWTIEYERTYPHPIDRVFRAVTDQADVAAWFFPPAEIDPRLGGAYALGGINTVFKGVITAFEPPRFVRYGGPEPHGPECYWQFELTSAPSGTQMRFIQHSQPGFWTNLHGWLADPAEHPAGALNPWWPGTLSGWHVAFDQLGDLMDEVRVRQVDQPALEARYRALMRETQP